jgi:hypothetical protein
MPTLLTVPFSFLPVEVIAEVRELADAATYQQIVDEVFQVWPSARLDPSPV